MNYLKRLYCETKNRVSSIIDNATGMVIGTVGTALVVSAPARAAVDVTAVVAEVSGAAAPIAAIGAAVLLVLVGIKVFKWVRRAM